MKCEIKHGPSYSTLYSEIEPDESITAQSGAMSSMSSNVELSTYIPGGFIRGLVRKLFARESFFMNDYYVQSGSGEITISPEYPGRIIEYSPAEQGEIMIQPSAFLAKTGNIEIRTKFMGLKSLFSGEGAFFLKCSGNGTLYFNAYGDIVEKEIKGEYIVDTGHVVGFEPGLDFKIRGFGGIKSTFLSGEGLVMRFEGTGKIYIQSRTIGSLASWITPFLPS